MNHFHAQNSTEILQTVPNDTERSLDYLLHKVPFMSSQHAKAYDAIVKKQSTTHRTKMILCNKVVKSKHSSGQNSSSTGSTSNISQQNEKLFSRHCTKCSTTIMTSEHESSNSVRTSSIKILSLISPKLAKTHGSALRSFSELESSLINGDQRPRSSLPNLNVKSTMNTRRSSILERTQNAEVFETDMFELSKSVTVNERRSSMVSLQPLHISTENDSQGLSISNIEEDHKMNMTPKPPSVMQIKNISSCSNARNVRAPKETSLKSQRRLISMTQKMNFSPHVKQNRMVKDLLIIKRCGKGEL